MIERTIHGRRIMLQTPTYSKRASDLTFVWARTVINLYPTPQLTNRISRAASSISHDVHHDRAP